jgi:Zn-dependent peptidase ImmA (M78 family)
MIVDMNRVSWLSRTQIEREADSLLLQWSAFTGRDVLPPIPVEAIIEKYLDVSLEYDDLDRILGIPDVLGATWVEERKMAINSSLLGGVEGRISFTCSHEIGHWVLHRKYFFGQFTRSQRTEHENGPAVVCRISTSKLRGEWQADYFGACLIMPEVRVRESYEDIFGPEPLVLYNVKSCFGRHNSFVLDPALDTVKDIALKVINRGGFTNVSKESMVYRLHDLGLLINRAERSLATHFKRINAFFLVGRGERGLKLWHPGPLGLRLRDKRC